MPTSSASSRRAPASGSSPATSTPPQATSSSPGHKSFSGRTPVNEHLAVRTPDEHSGGAVRAGSRVVPAPAVRRRPRARCRRPGRAAPPARSPHGHPPPLQHGGHRPASRPGEATRNVVATSTNDSGVPPPASRRSGIPTTTAHGRRPRRRRPASGRGSRRAASSPTAAPATNGQAVATVPASAEPSSWDRRPSRTNTSTATRSAIKAGIRRRTSPSWQGPRWHRTAWQDRRVLTVATVNVNGVRAAVRRGMRPWLAERAPDVLCLQEVRATDADLAAALGDGWFTVHEEASARGRAGVAVATRTPPVDVRAGLAPSRPSGPATQASTAPAAGSRRTCRRSDRLLTVDLGLRAHGRGGTPRQDWRRRPSSRPPPSGSTPWRRTAGTSCSRGTSTSPTARRI